MTSSQWHNLNRDILLKIYDVIDTRVDKTRFRSVCQPWRSYSSSPTSPSYFDYLYRFQLNLPGSVADPPKGWFECVEKIVYIFEPLNPTSGYTKTPWLAVLERSTNGNMHILNPFTGERMHVTSNYFPKHLDTRKFRVTELKNIKQFVLSGTIEAGERERHIPEDIMMDMFRICKVVVLTTPSNSSLLCVLVKFGFYFCKVEGHRLEIIRRTKNNYKDIGRFSNKVYAIDCVGNSISVDASLNYNEIEATTGFACVRHLVETPEALYLVEIDQGENDAGYPKSLFKVYMLSHDGRRWVDTNDIGGYVFVLGSAICSNWSFSVSPSNFTGWKQNCILFTDEYAFYENEHYVSSYEDIEVQGHKLSVYDMESGTIGLLKNFRGFSDVIWPPPIWIRTMR